MYYAKSLRGTLSNKTREWRLCLRHEDEKRRILQSCHESQTGELLNYEAYLPFVHVVYMNDSVLFVYVSDAGGHLGRDKTIEKICSRFYWGRNMHKEIHDYIRSCERCQRNNDVFHNPNSTFQSQEKFGNRCNTSSLGTVNFFYFADWNRYCYNAYQQ